MTVMDELIAFLRARLDEREAKARAAGEIGTPDWHVGDDGSGDPESNACVLDGSGEIVVYDEGRPRLAEAEHMADNDPAWVLDDVAAKRKILEQAVLRGNAVRTATLDGGFHDYLIRLLAFPYAGRPDYLKEWKP